MTVLESFRRRHNRIKVSAMVKRGRSTFAVEPKRRKQRQHKLLHHQNDDNSGFQTSNSLSGAHDAITRTPAAMIVSSTSVTRKNEKSCHHPSSASSVQLPWPIDETTCRLMQVEAYYCIQHFGKNETTVGHVIEILRRNPVILHSMGVNNEWCGPSSGGKAAASSSSLMTRKKKNFWHTMHAQNQRKATALMVWQRLATEIDLAQPVTSWMDFKLACREYWQFPSLHSPANQQPQPKDVLVSSRTEDNVYVQRLRQIDRDASIVDKGLSTSRRLWQSIAATQSIYHDGAKNKAEKYYQNMWDKAVEQRNERLTSHYLKTAKNRWEAHVQAEEAARKASQLLRPLTADERAMIQQVWHAGAPQDIVAQYETDFVTRQNMLTLLPGKWISDEVLHFFLSMLAQRDAEMVATGQAKRRSHFFKSFFVTKLLNQGHSTQAGVYEYRNVKRWSKKVPGKDIFALDKIVFPININESHWVCAVAFMQERKIQFYDSMVRKPALLHRPSTEYSINNYNVLSQGDHGLDFLQAIFRYIQDEHLDKKKTPLPNADEWELIPCTPDTPQQENGADCGIFVCMFADFVTKNCPLSFQQRHINQCRDRIALAILRGKAIM